MSFTKINHYEKEYADTHHECALTVTEGVENQPVVNPYFVRKKKRAPARYFMSSAFGVI